MFENPIFEIAEFFNQILIASLIVMVLSYMIRAASFNFKEKIIKSYFYLLFSLLIMYSGEILNLLKVGENTLSNWNAIQWTGVVFFPATFIHFADSILATTGRPSKGKRTFLIQSSYLTSIIFFFVLSGTQFLADSLPFSTELIQFNNSYTNIIFSIYYFIIIGLSFSVMFRAIRRTKLKASRRRLGYLVIGAMTIAIGSFPYVFITANVASTYPVYFVNIAMITNIFILMALALVGYAITFFGVDWPDRIVKQRLIKWLLRGPVTAIIILILLAIYNSTIKNMIPYSDFVLMALMVLSVVILQHSVTFLAPIIEKFFITQVDKNSYIALKSLEERLVTQDDFIQFSESILSALCNRLDTNNAFIGIINQTEIESYITIGNASDQLEQLSENIESMNWNTSEKSFHFLNGYYFSFLTNSQNEKIGLMGFSQPNDFDIENIEDEDNQLIKRFQERATLLLVNRINQKELLANVVDISPDVSYIQRLQAAARYDTEEILDIQFFSQTLDAKTLSKHLKDALKHYWGGPNLSESPLLNLKIVRDEIRDSDQNEISALRIKITDAIEKIKPNGDRKYTSEWLLYNILEMKYLQGMKGRDVCRRLAMSEADFYRKQKIAINEIARVLFEMEQESIE